MKIVQVVTQMEAGGAQKVAHLLHEGLRERGHETELWFLYTKRPAYAKLKGVRSLLPHSPKPLDYFTIFGSLQRELRRTKPDVLISHTHYANVMAQVAARNAGIRKRIAVHHNPLPTYPKPARAADWLLGQSGAYTDVVAVSNAVVDTVRSYPDRYKRLVSRIYNGLPSADTTTAKDVRERWEIPEDKPLIVNVGRLSKQKNQATLIRALAEIPEAHLAIVGDGELSAALKQQALDAKLRQRVHFTGELPPADVFSILSRADVFAFPSLFESMGLALVEAMQMALPIVAADLPALHEVLEDSALFVPPRDSSALAAAVKRILSNRDEAREMGWKARERSLAFSSEAMIEAYDRAIWS